MVEVRGLKRSYGPVQALCGIDFRIDAGQVVGFLGPNGAGKTTAMKILTGYLAADSGCAAVCGFSVEEAPLEVKQRVGYLPENNPLYSEQRVCDFLNFAGLARGLNRLQRRQALDRVVALTGLEPVFRRPIGECSKGFRQRVGLAQALLHDPPLLILDEPTNGLDPNQTQEMRQRIRELGTEKTVLLTSHVLPEVEALAERVILIHQGLKVADGLLNDLRTGQSEADQGLAFRLAIRASTADLQRFLETHQVEAVEVVEAPWGRPDLAAVQARVEDWKAWEALTEAVVQAALPVVEMTPLPSSLEAVFQRLTRAGESGLAQESNDKGGPR
ncbi:MAG: ATP-binding cassette domain-containing protein [Planctomycetota bacterium]|nr:MAG: ATP-binding cassette domain-containing protein [Planctomycetota bacterium]